MQAMAERRHLGLYTSRRTRSPPGAPRTRPRGGGGAAALHGGARGVLRALIRVVEHRLRSRPPAPDRHVERADGQPRLHVPGHRPPDHVTAGDACGGDVAVGRQAAGRRFTCRFAVATFRGRARVSAKTGHRQAQCPHSWLSAKHCLSTQRFQECEYLASLVRRSV